MINIKDVGRGRQAVANKWLVAHDIWWIDPKKLLLFVTLPAFFISSSFAEEAMPELDLTNYINGTMLFLGTISIVCIIIGCAAGQGLMRGVAPTPILDRRRVDLAIVVMASASIMSHLILIGLILMDLDTVMAAMRGEQGLIYQVKQNINKISGITSFTQLYIIFLPLYAAYQMLFGRRPPIHITFMVVILLVLVFIRAFVILERFALIEAAVPLVVCYLSFRPKRAIWVGYIPIVGFVLLYMLFAAGEFTRSWAYHADFYDSFFDYVNLRLVGYIATATNNASGIYQYYGTMFWPSFTMFWIPKLPLWDFIDYPFDVSPIAAFLEDYASTEFNNPSGILAGVLDYGIFISMFYNILMGVIGGVLYSQFRKGSAFALIYFPAWYMGYLLLTQAIYWGDPRVFTVTIIAPFVAYYVSRTPPRVPQGVIGGLRRPPRGSQAT